jgi:hypothetical protein
METGMALQTDLEPIDAETTESEQASRLKRYDQRVEEWLTSLKDEAGQRSPEVLSALAAKAKDVGEYLDKMAEKARSRNETSAPPLDATTASEDESVAGGQVEVEHGYHGPDPEADPHGDKANEDQGT